MASEEQLVEYLRRVTSDLHDARQRLRRIEERGQEPVAVVAMACRFPGDVDTPEAFWELVSSGTDAIGDFPANRGWDLDGLYHPDPDHPGTCYTRKGGFLYDADRFDAAFFGISPREALASSPQQRLLLESAWEALERAGIDPVTLKGSQTGVYAGTATTGDPLKNGPSQAATEGYAGSAPSLLSGRIAYTLGLEGPAVTVETACSSSLVAMHLAAQALRQGECSLALAGGVTVMATPEIFTGFSRQRGLSRDGRCKAFAASADGTGWGEGVGLVVLERLTDAERNGRRVLAVIRGSAINQDGASNGFTAPNGPSQQRVIRQALRNARLSAAEVDAVEAHGTGTVLGDSIEADALIATYGRDRPEDRPLWLGSVKSNIGHTQGAAGVAGIIKMIMAIRHGVLPASLHIDEPTPQVDWGSGAVRPLTGPVEWPRTGRPRRAGVSSFGISGTNAHMVIEQAPEPEPAPDLPDDGRLVPWVLTARSAPALRERARALAARVDDRTRAVDVGWSLATTRSAFEHRAVVLGVDPAELRAGVEALAAGEEHPAVVGPGVREQAGRIAPVLVFPGQGSQWAGMGAELLESSPVFAARIAECERALAPYVDWSLTEVLRGDGAELSRVDVVQPVLWAMMVSLAAVWAHHGVVPAAVVGHSQGEIAAACVAGALSIEDAAKVVAVRSRALRALSGGGAMASLGVPGDEAARLAELHAPEVVVAAVNGPASTVVSGPPGQVAALVARAEADGLRARTIDVDYASHGPQVDQITGELTERLTGVNPVGAETAFYSTVTGGRTDTSGLDAGYWVTNLRQRVRFADAIDALLADGHRVFIEASPHPVLALGVEECAERAGVPAAVVATLRRDHGGRERLARALGEAFTAGVAVDWAAWFPADPAPRVVDLPTYPFQRLRFWQEYGPGHGGDPAGLGLRPAEHALLGAAVDLAEAGSHLLTGRLSVASGPDWLADHRIGDTVLVPGAALVEWALRAADEAGCDVVEDLVLRSPLVLPPSGGVRVQVQVGAADDEGRREVRIHSRPGDDAGWVCHAVGVLGPGTGAAAEGLDGAWPPLHARPLDVADLYERAAEAGYGYGPAFQGLRAAWRDGEALLAEVTLPEAAGGPEGFGIHPALLDAALHPLLLTGEPGDGGRVWLPFAWTGVTLSADAATTVRVRLTPRPDGDPGERTLRLSVADAAGAPVLTAGSVVLRPVEAGRLDAAARRGPDGLFTLDWIRADVHPTGARPEGLAVLGAEPVLPEAARHPDLPALVAALDDGAPPPSTVLAGIPTDGDGPAAVVRALELVRGWLAEPRLADARLAVLTRGATGDEADPAGAAVWGLLRGAQAEHPDRFLLLDLDPGGAPPTGLLEAVAWAVEADEPQLALRPGRVLVPRLAPARTPDGDRPVLDPDGTVLITGGTGALGGRVAEHLVRSWGVRRLLLVSRRGLEAPGAGGLAERLTGLGAQVRVVAADVADPGVVVDLVASVGALTGVVHAAGVLDDALVTSMSAERLANVWAPKATAALNLHTATAGLPLGMFVLFSSAAGVLGNVGQAGYAAANAFVDALAARRRAAGLPALSIAWGLWERTSAMTGHLAEADRTHLSRSGLSPLPTERALELLDAASGPDRPSVVAAAIDVRGLPAAEIPALLRTPGRTRRRTATGGAGDTAGPAASLAGLGEEERRDAVLDLVRRQVAAVLGFAAPADVRAEASFKDLGFESLTAVDLRNRLAVATGQRLPATLVFDHPTPKALTAYLCARLAGQSGAAGAPAVAAAAPDEPVAIVAMACRYPGGVGSPEDLWDLVAGGADAMGEFPTDRGWDLEGLFHPDPDHAGTSYADQGAFLDDAAGFDAGFFGISPREALAMDPQQRLLLETSWEVLERAGIDPVSLRGSRTGVYAGVMYHDYAAGLAGVGDAKLEGYSMLASSGSAIAGRVAYTLGLEGPAMAVDTACSSSLVAMHLAAQALRQGECTLALAGGVTVLATPEVFVGFSRQRGLAPDGRCKPFAAAADGTGWGEGAGLVLLERLSDARRNGRRVLAVVRGSAVNQDGASNGLTAPNGPSQERVIRQALASARLSPDEVDAVEAHGTGTTLGDPIEAQALLATYGKDREHPLWLGSVKSNIGHTQAAAGVAGVIKMVLAMRHGRLPASLHIDEPSPHVDWDSGAVRLLTEPVTWPGGERPRRAAVSSFGASGTNAHLILEHAVEPEPEPVPYDGVLPWVLSARADAALRAQAAALAEHVERGEATPAEVAWSLVASRSVFDHRAVVVGADRDGLLDGLRALAAGEAHPAVVTTETAVPAEPGPVLVFPGQGSQWAGMGVELLECSPVFAARMAECERALAPYVDWSVTGVLRGDGSELARVEVVQPVLWAVMVSLAAVWDSYGVRPAAVVGHSQGEIAAACVAGVLSLGDGARIVALRSRALRRLAGGGAMASLGVSEARAGELLDGDVVVAACNGPSSTVISGPPGQVAAIVAEAQAADLPARMIDVDYASHGPQVDEITDELHDVLAGVEPAPSRVAFYSTVTAAPIDGAALDTAYWVTNLRRPVRFADTVRALLQDGHRMFVEVAPHPVLTTGLLETFEEAGTDAAAVPTLRRDQGGTAQLAHALGQAFTAGAGLDWTRWFPARPRLVDLPTYAFQHERYWLEGRATGGGDPASLGLAGTEHPLLTAAVDQAGADRHLFTGRLSTRTHPWLADHRVRGTVLVPGAAMVEWALRAADEVGCAAVEELTLREPFALPESGGVRVQVVAEAAGDDGRRELRVYSRADDDDTWTWHAEGLLGAAGATPATEPGGTWPPPGATPVDVGDLYEQAREAGYEYGPAFRGLRAAWRDGADLLAEVTLPGEAGEPGGFGVHPALLDAVLQAVLTTAGPDDDGRVWLPFAWTGVSLWASDATTVRVRLTPLKGENGVRVEVADAAGAPVLTIGSVVMRPAERIEAVRSGGTDGLFTVDWTPLETAEASGDDPFVLEAGTADLSALLDGLDDGEPAPALVLAGTAPPEEENPDAAGLRAVERTLELVQAWLAEPRLADVPLVVVTRGAVAAEAMSDAPDPAAAGVWGLVRSAQSEHPGRFFLLDTEPDIEPDTGLRADAVTGAARRTVSAGEPHAALRGGRVLVPRLTRAGGPELPAAPGWRLDPAGTATLDGIAPVACPEVLEPLKPGQVRVAVRAAGINFRDVVVSLDMAPGQTGIGSEGAGVVLDVGPDVTGIAVGDRVMGLFEGAFGPVAVADARMVAPIPDGWGWREAAAVPVVVLTAWYGLVDLAGLRAGESVLIHAATGGVGMAAVRIARHLGAEVYATASPGKHAVLERMGIDAAHRASSRDLDFEESFGTATGGRGVDVVLNSLTGEFVDASLRLLAEGGRFLEMGKTDIRDPGEVGRAHPGVTYQAFDLVTDAGPDGIGRLFGTVGDLFTDGTLRPARVSGRPIGRAREALRYLSQARHTGKLVLDVPAPLDPDGTVLITGGTGTLGASVAEHLAREWGAGHLLLVSRRGPEAPGAKKLAERLILLGAQVRIVAADVADADAVSELVAGVEPAHPLTGVIHAAGVLDDGVVEALSPGRLAHVWGAKATAAQNLHRATLDADLALFVLFSSSAATLGSPGQGNYAAANAFCDALAAARQAAGLPGVSIGWGLWAEASGMTGHLDEAQLARMARSGVGALSGEAALRLFDAGCRHGDPHPLAVDLDVRALAARPAEQLPALLRALTGAGRARRTAAAAPAPTDWAGRLAVLSREEQDRVLLDLVRTNAAAVLGHADAGAVRSDVPFKDLGFDSLTAVELRNRLAAASGLRLPATFVFRHPTPAAIAGYLRERLAPGSGESPGPVFAELERLESAMTRFEPGEDARGRLVKRLEALLWRLEDGTDAAGPIVGGDALESATDDELFDLIDREVSS